MGPLGTVALVSVTLPAPLVVLKGGKFSLLLLPTCFAPSWGPRGRFHIPLLLHGEIQNRGSGHEGGPPAADISREGRAWQGRAGARGKFLVITEITLMRKAHLFTLQQVLSTTVGIH